MIEFLERPIAFHRAFIELGVGVTGALLPCIGQSGPSMPISGFIRRRKSGRKKRA